MHDRGDVVHGAVFAAKVAGVGHDDRAQDLVLSSKQDRLHPEPCKIKNEDAFIRLPSQDFMSCSLPRISLSQ